MSDSSVIPGLVPGIQRSASARACKVVHDLAAMALAEGWIPGIKPGMTCVRLCDA